MQNQECYFSVASPDRFFLRNITLYDLIIKKLRPIYTKQKLHPLQNCVRIPNQFWYLYNINSMKSYKTFKEICQKILDFTINLPINK